MDGLEDLLHKHGFWGCSQWVHCFTHTLNLAAKATLSQFEKKKGKKKKWSDDNTLETLDFNDLPLLDPIEINVESQDDLTKTDMLDLEDLTEMVINEEGDKEKEGRDEEQIVDIFETLTEEAPPSTMDCSPWTWGVHPISQALSSLWCINLLEFNVWPLGGLCGTARLCRQVHWHTWTFSLGVWTYQGGVGVCRTIGPGSSGELNVILYVYEANVTTCRF